MRARTYSYLIDDGSENKKAKCSKKCVIKIKLEFEDYKNCLEATQLENKINHLEKNKIDIGSLKENHKTFIKNNKLKLKTQRRFTNKMHNVFTAEGNKNALSANDDKRIQSIDSIETYAYRTCKDLICKKKKLWQYNKTLKEMINFDDVIKGNIKEHNPNWQEIPDHWNIILIAGDSGSRGKKFII